LADLAAAFNAARATNQTAALNEFLTYEPTSATPDKMLLIESANYSALDLSRTCNCPPYLLGISTGSYAYTNSRESRIDLWTFGTKAYAEVIASTLSADNILPRGTYVEFDVDDYIGEFHENSMSQEDSELPEENTQESLA
jgi:phage portal protein BeeE